MTCTCPMRWQTTMDMVIITTFRCMQKIIHWVEFDVCVSLGHRAWNFLLSLLNRKVLECFKKIRSTICHSETCFVLRIVLFIISSNNLARTSYMSFSDLAHCLASTLSCKGFRINPVHRHAQETAPLRSPAVGGCAVMINCRERFLQF